MKTKVKYALQTNLNQAFNPSPYQDGCEQHRRLLDTEYEGSTQTISKKNEMVTCHLINCVAAHWELPCAGHANLSVPVVQQPAREHPCRLEHCCLQSHVKVAALIKASPYYMTKTNFNGTQSVKEHQSNQACEVMHTPQCDYAQLTLPSSIISLIQKHQIGKTCISYAPENMVTYAHNRTLVSSRESTRLTTIFISRKMAYCMYQLL